MSFYSATVADWQPTPAMNADAFTTGTVRAKGIQPVFDWSESLTRLLHQQQLLTIRIPAEQATLAPALTSVVNKLNELLKLPPNWDSYGARPPELDAAVNAFALIERIVAGGESMPRIVPTVDGGIQLEWHANSKYLEVVARADKTLSAYFEDEDGGEPFDEDLAWNSPLLPHLVGKMQSIVSVG